MNIAEQSPVPAAAVCFTEHARTILESITDGFYAFDAGWRFTYLNEVAKRHLASYVEQPENLLGRNYWDISSDARGPIIERESLRAAAEGATVHYETFCESCGRWYNVRGCPIRSGGLAVYFRDVTEEKRAAEALRASEQKFRSLFRSLDEAFCVMDVLWDAHGQSVDCRFVEVNPAFESQTGLHDAQGRTMSELTPGFEQHWVDTYGRVARTGEPIRFRQFSERLNRLFDLYAFRIGTEAHPQVALLFRDVTGQDREEAALAQVSEQRRLALYSARLGWWHFDVASGVVEWNERSQELYGLPSRRTAYGDFLACIHPEDREARTAALQAALRTEDPQPYLAEYRVIHPDGTVRWLQAKGQATFCGEGAERQAVAIDGTVGDITEVRAAQEALRESESSFRQLADSMPQIVWTARPDGVCDHCNQRWYDYIQKTRAEAAPANWGEHVCADDLPAAVMLWSGCVASGEPFTAEYRLRRADGECRWFLVRAVAIRCPEGRITRWYGTCTDIHEQRALLEENAHLLDSERVIREEAERIGRVKDEFLATLSHELRTPLNAILGWTQVLRADPANTEDMEAGLATIERNARAQTRIIEDLLDMSRIISGKVRLDVQSLDLVAVLEAALDTVRLAADAKGICLQTAFDPQARTVSGDPNRLQQVFWNLLTNAIKFTPSGGRVQVLLKRVDLHLEVSVIDSGEGIAPEFLDYVFDRFRQQDASTTRKHGGLGLGLAIVKQLAELHGGTVYVRSAGFGQGATFNVQLPLAVVPPAAALTNGERQHPAEVPSSWPAPGEPLRLDGIKVLVVDDEPDACELVRRLLEDRQAVVRTAGSVAQALERFAAETPDVLVSDVGMPDEDGYSLIRHVRALPAERGGHTRAVALTAYARAEDRLEALKAGFQVHLAKPVEAAELLAVVASLVERGGESVQAAQGNNHPSERVRIS